MQPFRVVMPALLLDRDLNFSLRLKFALINKFVPEFRVGALAITICPLSYALGCVSLGYIGGFGSSGFDIKLLGVDGSSDGFGWPFL